METVVLPKDVVDAICTGSESDRYAERVFTACAKHWTSTVMALWTGEPSNGGPILGFTPELAPGNKSILNAFKADYFDNTGKMVSKYMTITDISKIPFTCINQTFAESLFLIDPELAKRAAGQVGRVYEMVNRSASSSYN